MLSTLIQMTLIMLCGVVWRVLKPAKLSAEQVRLVLTSTVYYLFLPVLVLDVLWRCELGWNSLQYSLLGAGCIGFGIALSFLMGQLFTVENRSLGAMILASAFPNVTYLGLPVLEQAFGSFAKSVAIQIDLFAAAPLVFTVGVMIARHYGEDDATVKTNTLSFFNAPPFWAAAVAVLLNVNGIHAPEWLAGVLQKLSVAVVPLMLFSLGLALSWRSLSWHSVRYLLPVVLIKMLLMPLFALNLATHFLRLPPTLQAAAIMDVAMPSMLLGVVFCDRYRLDSSLYAMMVTITTLLSLFCLPFWFAVLAK